MDLEEERKPFSGLILRVIFFCTFNYLYCLPVYRNMNAHRPHSKCLESCLCDIFIKLCYHFQGFNILYLAKSSVF